MTSGKFAVAARVLVDIDPEDSFHEQFRKVRLASSAAVDRMRALADRCVDDVCEVDEDMTSSVDSNAKAK